MSAAAAVPRMSVATWLELLAADSDRAWAELLAAATTAARRGRWRGMAADDVAAECVSRVMTRTRSARGLEATDADLTALCAGFVARIRKSAWRDERRLRGAVVGLARLQPRWHEDADEEDRDPARTPRIQPVPGAMTGRQAAARAALRDAPSARDAARRLGVSRSSLQRLVSRGAARALGLSAPRDEDRTWAREFAASSAFDSANPAHIAVALRGDGQPYERIAAALHLRVEAARSRVRRVRARLAATASTAPTAPGAT